MSNIVRSHGFTALGPLHEAFARLQGKAALGVAALLGALSALAFAPFHFTAVLIVSFTGLIWMLDGARGYRNWGKAIFARGWAFGAGFFLISMYWTAAPFLVEPEKTGIFIFMPLILLPGGMALIWGAAAAMAGAFWSSSPSRIFVFSLFFALGEYARGHLFGGFPWNLAATSWVPGGAMSQAASIGGVYWLTLLTVFVVSTPAALVDTRDKKGLAQRLLPVLTAVVVVALAWAWGAQRIATPTVLTEQAIVLVDSGVPQNEKWAGDPNLRWDMETAPVFNYYIQALQRADSAAGDIVIWPEGAVPTTLLQNPDAMDVISARLGPRNLIMGTTRYQPNGNGSYSFSNSLVVVDEEAGRSGPVALYDKHRLVPFGELPASEIIPFGKSIAGILPNALQRLADSGFQPGAGPAVIYADDVPPFAAMICYEALYPEIARAANLDARADWMVVISNDAWFGSGMGPAQHYAQNRYRSIETGLPTARVATRGASAIIDGYGREVMRAGPATDVPETWNAAYGRGYLPAPVEVTIYQRRLGFMLFWLTIALFAGLSFISWRR